LTRFALILCGLVSCVCCCVFSHLQGHYDRVVRRMHLTQQQVRHFAAVLEEIGRLDDAVMAQGGQLARNAACPSTLVLAAEAERGAAAAAAAAGAAARCGKGTDCDRDNSSSSLSSSSGGMLGHIARADANASEDSSDGVAAAAAAAASTPAGVRSARGRSAAAAAAASAGDIMGSGSTPADSAAAAAAESPAAADAEVDDNALAPPGAESLLQRNVGRLPLHAMLLLVFNCNTLTRVQLAKW
jgi:hypothetical protein